MTIKVLLQQGKSKRVVVKHLKRSLGTISSCLKMHKNLIFKRMLHKNLILSVTNNHFICYFTKGVV